MDSVCYADETPMFFYNVTYIVRSSGVKLTRSFDSEYLARKFARKLMHSKTCDLVSYPMI